MGDDNPHAFWQTFPRVAAVAPRSVITPSGIREALNRIPARPPEGEYPAGFFDSPPRRAAVLMPLLYDGGEPGLLFIRRSILPNDRHSGQVAFPGGAMDERDASAEAAALRETREELGIPVSKVEVLGRLPDFHTVSNYIVTPVVGLLEWPIPLTIEPAEVARVFTIPLAWLMDPANRYVQRRGWSAGHTFSVIFYQEYDGESLWGASARFVVALIEALSASRHGN